MLVLVVLFLVISHTLKKNNPAVKVYAVEANESSPFWRKPGPHKSKGFQHGFIPNTLDTNAYDGVRRVSSEEALNLHALSVELKDS